MKIKDIKQFEQMCLKEWTDDQLFEMANIHSQFHGIDNIVIWVGLSNKRHGLRIKVSNLKNKFDIHNHFEIRMLSLDYDYTKVASWITSKHMKKILSWIKINQQLLVDYETGLIDNTQEFLNRITSV